MEQKRIRLDKLSAGFISVVGILTGSVVCLILAYLVYVTLPLLKDSHISDPSVPLNMLSEAFVGISSKNEHIIHVDKHGQIQVIDINTEEVVSSTQVQWPNDFIPTHIKSGLGENRQFFLLSNDESFMFAEANLIFQYPNFQSGDYHTYELRPQIETSELFTYQLTLPFTDSSLWIDSVRVTENGWSMLVREYDSNQGYIIVSEDDTIQQSIKLTLPEHTKFTAITSNTKMFAIVEDGGIFTYDLRISKLSNTYLEPSSYTKADIDGSVSAISLNQGGSSLLLGDSKGTIQLYSFVRTSGEKTLTLLRTYTPSPSRIVLLAVETGKKGFVSVDDAGNLQGYFQTIADKQFELALAWTPTSYSVSMNSEIWFFSNGSNQWQWLEIHNEHAEVNVETAFAPIWYEGYDQPAYLWQSTAAVADFEPKMSLTPLIIGTLKGALYALLFSLPLALFGACYTARFMHPSAREYIKPAVEIFGSFPTVIIGFVAALWLAPVIEEELISVFIAFLIVPAALFGMSYLVGRFKFGTDSRIEGLEFVMLIPALFIAIALSGVIGSYIEIQWLGMPTIDWLEETWGIDYQQRNGLIVGLVMGIAVIPLIYSISEDAFYGVPESLIKGALALGARPWQVAITIMFPAALPGLFSATMIGFGRAVGETMIVMMAAGNTALTQWSFWTGMRTLSANIAVEMPEAEIGSTHFRILFVSALLLLVFTFFINTVAETVRQRLREQYSGL